MIKYADDQILLIIMCWLFWLIRRFLGEAGGVLCFSASWTTSRPRYISTSWVSSLFFKYICNTFAYFAWFCSSFFLRDPEFQWTWYKYKSNIWIQKTSWHFMNSKCPHKYIFKTCILKMQLGGKFMPTLKVLKKRFRWQWRDATTTATTCTFIVIVIIVTIVVIAIIEMMGMMVVTIAAFALVWASIHSNRLGAHFNCIQFSRWQATNISNCFQFSRWF